MTRDQVRGKLADMKMARMRGLEAENVAEEREFANQWHRLWREVQPYVDGTKAYSDEQREAA